MADRTFVVDHALCFLFSRLHRADCNATRRAIENVYSAQDISHARLTLLDDASSLNLEHLRRLPARRTGDARKQRELDDIFTILSAVDEAQAINKLAKYVSDDPLKMPTSLLTEGDLRTVMDRMNCFETKLDKITDLQIAMLSGVRPTLQQSMHGQHAVNKSVTAAATAAGSRHTGPTAEPTDRQSARPTDNTESVQQPPVSCSVNPSVAPSTDDQSEPYHTVLSRNGTKKLPYFLY